MTLISKNIRYLRRLHGLTQEQFAQKLDIKRSLLGAYEEGRAVPNLTNLMNIGKIFGLTIEQLISLDLRKVQEDAGSFIEVVQLMADVKENESEESTPSTPFGTPSQKYNFHDENEELEEDEPVKKHFSSGNPLKELSVKPLNGHEQKNLKSTTSTHSSIYSQESDFTENAPKKYLTLEDEELFSDTYNPQEDDILYSSGQGGVPFIRLSELTDYLASYQDEEFIDQLPHVQVSLLPPQKTFRAFEASASFPIPKSILIGEYVKNWYALAQEACIFLTQRQGLLYGKIENKLKSEGYFIMCTSEGTHKIAPKEIFEIWKFVLMLSTHPSC